MSKPNIFYPLFALCALLAFASCKKDGSLDPTASGGKLECKINGETWKAESISTVMIKTDQTGIWSKTLNMTGTGPGGELFTIVITDIRNASEGECLGAEEYISIGDDRVEENHSESANGIDYLSGSSGTVIYPNQTATLPEGGSVFVTECSNNKVSGTFGFQLFTLDDDFNKVGVAVTEGTFEDVGYIVQ